MRLSSEEDEGEAMCLGFHLFPLRFFLLFLLFPFRSVLTLKNESGTCWDVSRTCPAKEKFFKKNGYEKNVSWTYLARIRAYPCPIRPGYGYAPHFKVSVLPRLYRSAEANQGKAPIQLLTLAES